MTGTRAYAVVGVSLTDATKYGTRIFADLRAAGYTVYAVNPKGGTLLGETVYRRVTEVPAPLYGAILVVPPAALQEAVEQCIAAKVREIYFQPGARDPKAYQKAVAAGIKAVESCFMAEQGLW